MDYVLVTPVRDGAKYVRETIGSVISQQHPPLEWVIVDDGSTDSTGQIIDEAARDKPWITVIHRADRGYYLRGPGVVDAVEEGYQALRSAAYDVWVKLDADLRFSPDFFAKLMDAFEQDPSLGIAGGRGFQTRFGIRLKSDWPGDTVFGGTRCYRQTCYDQINGMDRAWGWDAIDEAKAQALGWSTKTIEDAEFDHLKKQTLRNKFEHGRSAYVMGTGPMYASLRAIWRMKDWPIVIGGFAFAAGYLQSWVSGVDRNGTPEERAELRRQQHGRSEARVRQILHVRDRGSEH